MRVNVQGVTPSVVEIYGRPTLTLDQVAHALNVSRDTVERRLRSGRFPIPSLPREGREPWRWSAHAVDRYLRRTH